MKRKTNGTKGHFSRLGRTKRNTEEGRNEKKPNERRRKGKKKRTGRKFWGTNRGF